MFREPKSMRALLELGYKLGLFTRAAVGATFADKGGCGEHFAWVDGGTEGYIGEALPGTGKSYFKEIGPDSIFDIASVTKMIISLLWHALQSKGMLRFDSRPVNNDTFVAPILGMRGVHVDTLTVGDLHSFYAKFAQGHPTQNAVHDGGYQGLKEKLLFGGLTETPGLTWKYGNPHTILLGLVIEKLTGKSLLQCVSEQILHPLGMNSTSMGPRGKLDRVVMSEAGLKPGLINDVAARFAAQEMGSCLAGCAGLFSTPKDLNILIRMLLNKGVHNGVQVIASQTVETLHEGITDQFGNGVGRWPNFRRRLEDYAVMDDTGIFKLGHTGAILAVLPGQGFGFTVLTDFLMVPRASKADQDAARSDLYKLFAQMSYLAKLDFAHGH